MSEPEISIKSWDDPSLTYGVKDAETFYRVYGHDSRFYIASGPDMDASIKDYYTALTPSLPNKSDEGAGEEKSIETSIETTPADAPPSDSPVPESGSPEF